MPALLRLRRALALGMMPFCALLAAAGLVRLPAAAVELPAGPQVPKLTHTAPERWLNSSPLTWDEPRGKVVLLEFWTFACWNCYRSIAWLHTLEKKFAASDFLLLGVHTPELPQECRLDRLLAKMEEYDITNPVMIDNDYSDWKAMNNRYWPAFYLVDRHGRIRGRYVGETHVGDRNARRIEADIARVLAED